MTEQARQLLTGVLQQLVTQPARVSLRCRDEGLDSHVTIVCDPVDRGLIIGRRGVTIQSIRTIWGRIAAVTKRRVFFHIDGDDQRGVRS